MRKDARIFVAGHRGLAGSAICRRLRSQGYANLILRTREELDLTQQHSVDAFFKRESPEYVFLAAARVGGIVANMRQPADFIRDNLIIQTNVIDAAWRHATSKLIFLASSCIYPKAAPQPMRESDLLTGPLEPTNEPYAIAKIAGIKMLQAYRRQHGFQAISLMPTNLYGPNDNYHSDMSHVIPALIRRMHQAKTEGASEVVIWGSGRPLREFLHADDLAEAAEFAGVHETDEDILNVGSGEEVSIAELASMIAEVAGYTGSLTFDTTKPDGVARKLLDSSRIRALGWEPKVKLRDGLREIYRWYAGRVEAVSAT